jgi:xanthine dehydrogenase small subunit
MIALGAEIDMAGLSGTRRVPIGQFYTGYRKTVLAEDELVTAVRIPLLGESQSIKLYKVSRRKDLDISSFGAAIWIQKFNGIIEDIRLAFGGVGPMVLRLPKTESILRGHAPTLERFEQAAEIATEEVTPISDVRGSAEYRRTLAGNILIKFWHETIGPLGSRPEGALL